MEKKTRNNTQAVAGVCSQIRISESSDSEQHNEADREAKRGTRRPGEPGKNKHPERKLADTIAHQSLLFRRKITKIISDQEIILVASPEFGGLLQDPG